MPSNPSAALSVMADHLDRYQEEVGHHLTGYKAEDDGDIVVALVEAERALRHAARLVRKAAKTADR